MNAVFFKWVDLTRTHLYTRCYHLNVYSSLITYFFQPLKKIKFISKFPPYVDIGVFDFHNRNILGLFLLQKTTAQIKNNNFSFINGIIIDVSPIDMILFL